MWKQEFDQATRRCKICSDAGILLSLSKHDRYCTYAKSTKRASLQFDGCLIRLKVAINNRISLLAITDKMHTRKCTVFPFHPWDSIEQRKQGVVLWVPHNIEELIRSATEQLDLPGESCVLSEDGGKILDVDMINDGQKLYLISETH